MNEQFSAWLDGELGEQEQARVTATLVAQPERRRECETAWLIGDALREEPVLSVDFTDKVMSAIETEPTVLAPVARVERQRREMAAPKSRMPAWMSAAAAVAGVAIVGVMATSLGEGSRNAGPSQASLVVVQSAQNASVAGRENSSLDDDRAYMLAHQNGARAALPSASMYVRTVSVESAGAVR